MIMGQKFKTILLYGAILSLPMILMSVLAYVFDMGQNKVYGWISILIFIVSIILIQKYYRDNFSQGFISYGKLFGGTLLMVIIAPDQIEKMIQIAKVNLYEQEGLSSAQINKSIEFMTKNVFTPFALSLTALLSTFGQGLLLSLLTSIFLKKKADGFSEAMKDINEIEE
jgi:uncharacterized membrane protein